MAAFRTGGVELVGPLAISDFLILLAGVSLAGSIDKAGIDDAPFFGDEAFASEGSVEGGEEFLPSIALVFFNEFFEVPNGIGIGHFIAETQSQKTHKAEAVLDLNLGGFIAEAVVFLEDKDFEHEQRIKRWTPSFRPILRIVASDFFEHGAKVFPINEVT